MGVCVEACCHRCSYINYAAMSVDGRRDTSRHSVLPFLVVQSKVAYAREFDAPSRRSKADEIHLDGSSQPSNLHRRLVPSAPW